MPEDGQLQIEIAGDLAGILALGDQQQTTRQGCWRVASNAGCGDRI